jgi:predicted adenine nucleotide alpha hydrolase (AANH) superfamily ATPase
MSAQTFIVRTDTNEQKNVLKAFAKAMKIKFEVAKFQYSSEFIAKIKQSEKEIEQGKTVRIEKEDLSQFLGL